jgi:hypothetical protein
VFPFRKSTPNAPRKKVRFSGRHIIIQNFLKNMKCKTNSLFFKWSVKQTFNMILYSIYITNSILLNNCNLLCRLCKNIQKYFRIKQIFYSSKKTSRMLMFKQTCLQLTGRPFIDFKCITTCIGENFYYYEPIVLN